MPGIKHVQFRFRRKKYKDHEQIQRIQKLNYLKTAYLEDNIRSMMKLVQQRNDSSHQKRRQVGLSKATLEFQV